MSKSINMIAPAAANGGPGIGVMTAAGNPWTVADGVADELVNRGVATYANPLLADGAQNISNVTYDNNTPERVIGYDLGSAHHTVTYPDSTTIVDVGGGSTVTITLNGSGDVIKRVRVPS